jgi:hypothetical protein
VPSTNQSVEDLGETGFNGPHEDRELGHKGTELPGGEEGVNGVEADH